MNAASAVAAVLRAEATAASEDRIELERDLWLTLARAFLPPVQPEVAAALRSDLAADLAELAALLAIPMIDETAELAAALTGYDDEALLIHYSSLFLAPPVKARLNLGLYLDGGLAGPAMDALEGWYARHGVAKAGGFRDLPDHLTAVLEFVALLAGDPTTRDDSCRFANTFLPQALAGLIHTLDARGEAASPYRHLAAFTRAAALALYPAPAEVTGRKARRGGYRHRPFAGAGWRCCSRCGKPIARAREMAVIAKALSQAGLPADHLDCCPACRDGERDWQRVPIR